MDDRHYVLRMYRKNGSFKQHRQISKIIKRKAAFFHSKIPRRLKHQRETETMQTPGVQRACCPGLFDSRGSATPPGLTRSTPGKPLQGQKKAKIRKDEKTRKDEKVLKEHHKVTRLQVYERTE